MRSRQKGVMQLTEKQLRDILTKAVREATDRTTLIYLLAMVDTPKRRNKARWVAEVWQRANRYAGNVDEHLVKIREVKEILEAQTGIKTKGW